LNRVPEKVPEKVWEAFQVFLGFQRLEVPCQLAAKCRLAVRCHQSHCQPSQRELVVVLPDVLVEVHIHHMVLDEVEVHIRQKVLDEVEVHIHQNVLDEVEVPHPPRGA